MLACGEILLMAARKRSNDSLLVTTTVNVDA